MDVNDVFVVRSNNVSLNLVLKLMQSADSSEETKSWALSALFHAGYTHDDTLRDYVHEALEQKGLHVYSEYRVEARQRLQQPLTEEQKSLERAMFEGWLRTALNRIMDLQDEQGKPLFCQKNHWWAVFRIFVDLKIKDVRENKYEPFISLINSLNLEKVNATLDKSTLSNITTDPVFSLPFSKWQDNKPWKEGSRRITAFDRMYEIGLELRTTLQAFGITNNKIAFR